MLSRKVSGLFSDNLKVMKIQVFLLNSCSAHVLVCRDLQGYIYYREFLGHEVRCLAFGFHIFYHVLIQNCFTPLVISPDGR